MAMKQTQTKYFDCSDFGIEMCFGGITKNQENFKKLLNLGYNENTVNSVSVAGDQVTFTYSGAHNYKSNRVLRVVSGELALINDGEFWIDQVTTNTVVMTITGAPSSIEGGFLTKISPLGWDLVYELGNIQIYGMLHLDDTVRYVRMCFETNVNNRASIAVCIGKTYDPNTGHINDPNALQSTKNLSTPAVANIPKWDGHMAYNAYSDATYSSGFSIFGHGAAVGSKYHFGFQMAGGFKGNADVAHHIYGIFPTHCPYYPDLDYPVLVGIYAENPSYSGSALGNFCIGGSSGGHASVGNLRVRFDMQSAIQNTVMGSINTYTRPTSSLLPLSMDPFNTTTLHPLDIYEYSTSQYLGGLYGLYHALFNDTNLPAITASASPTLTVDVEFNSPVLLAASCGPNNATNYIRIMAMPIEEIKYAG